METTFAYYYFDTHKIQPLESAYKQVAPLARLNDGRCDQSGRFVVGDVHMVNRPPTNEKVCNVYQVTYAAEGSLNVRRIPEIPKAWCTNGIAFSPNGRTMYHTDTWTNTM